ncbi:type II secretion system F family protein [Arthrobacter oryzae]|uniref:type II secretion system F family protein n=1 Tax=Arthrobacter oryzae TaxID=409290 RepID=UPI00273BAB8E|nr:type II secretion system F family protein [Arthrobacter oryzae]WLQ06866.1 type II secretion system F family protein [Arthrobacter oryzae]
MVIVVQSQPPVRRDRRRPYEEDAKSQVSVFIGSAAADLNRYLAARNVRLYNAEALERAGVRLNQADFTILVAAGASVAGLAGLILQGAFLAVVFALAVPFAGHFYLKQRAAKRRGQFDDQLGDTLHLLTGGLRAGHSILRAIDASAAESPSPTAQEMRRIVTETSLGRDLLSALNDTAERMQSEDFVWIAQAIQINREVGGNLAEVLDQVNETIRERAEIKGQIKALAAEGKFSAYILMAMPVGIIAILMIISPGYMDVMFTEVLGWVLIGVSVVFMTIGALWLRKIVDLKF